MNANNSNTDFEIPPEEDEPVQSMDQLSDGLNVMFVRSGATDLDDQGRITGSLDLPLSELGADQTRKLAAELDKFDVDIIFSSPSIASQQTAQEISRDGKVKIRVEESLSNLDHGLWHGKSIAELKENQPKLYKQWQEQPETVCPPDGETVDQAKKRLNKFLKKLKKKFKTGLVALVVSEPLACIIRAELTQVEISELWQVEAKCGHWNIVPVPIDALV